MGEAGQFGDMFGALNSLFSGLAFAGVVLAIVLQSNELKLQRKELKLQREELEMTRGEAKRSADAQSALARLSALTAFLKHYEPIARDDLNPHGQQMAEKRVRELIGDLEKEYIRARGAVVQGRTERDGEQED